MRDTLADGGVLKTLSVSEGTVIQKGQVLAVLEDDRASAGVDEVQGRVAALEIARLRAMAEASGQPLRLNAFLRKEHDLAQAQLLLYEQNIIALEKETSALHSQAQLAREEYQLTERLFHGGNISRVELMRAERATLEIEQRLQGLQDKFRSEARKELSRIEEELASQRSKLQDRQSVLEHTTLRAPTDGIVKFLRFNTLGGVLRQGDELMQISPTDGQYIVEAKINPSDIGQLYAGQSAFLRFDAFDFNIYGALEGDLEYFSSDTLIESGVDLRNSQPYYRARLNIKFSPDSRIRPEQIKPGMLVTVDLVVGKRSVLQYLMKPITRAFSGALS